MADADEPQKSVAFGPYFLTGRLGEGGMCHVFRAYKDGTDFDVALKLLKDQQREDERVLDLFVTEADLSLLLKHPNLIRTLDAGEHRDRYFIAMELIEGPNLSDIAHQCARIGVPLPPDFTMFIINEVLAGLQALHDATAKSGRPLGLVHRDVTPSNVFISYDGRVILGDFGIAHIMAYGGTEPGQAVGKLGYLSPEVVTGSSIDRRSDLFGIGIILWELLTGERLFAGSDEEAVMHAIADAQAPRAKKVAPGLPAGVDDVVMTALAKKPKDRFQTADEMSAAMRPHWSTKIGHRPALAGFLAGLFRDDSQRYRERKANPPIRPRSIPKHEPIVLSPLPQVIPKDD